MGLNRWLGCIENPRTGREAIALPMPTRRRQRVLVVGGGPAGLQAAVTAAERGHHVTLFEKADRLGGQVPVAASVPSRAEFLDITRNLVSAAQRAGVDVKTAYQATAAKLRSESPDAVIVATGAVPQKPWWAGDLEQVVDVRDVLEGRAVPHGKVLVIDELGFHQATSVAELLADRGCDVEVATSGMVVGQDLGITLDMEGWLMRAHAKGILQSTDLVVMGSSALEDPADGADAADGEGREGVKLDLLHHPTGAQRTRSCDWVVVATHQHPVNELWHSLRDDPTLEVHRIGDAVAPRRAHSAVIEGHRAAVAL
jgi:2,4-dienoyl-CoA reductase (NADPH2)